MPDLRTTLMIVAAAVASGCGKPEPLAPPPVAASAPVASASVPQPQDAWLGRWQGPEGTWLEVTGGTGTYRVTVSNLDGPRTFDAKAGSDSLVMLRDGTAETIRPGSGPDTGMKWLADKRDCLVVKRGEGYCRD